MLSTVYGYVGTPPAQRQLSSLVWRLGPSHFLEEVLPATSVAAIYELGPNYVGSFQAVYLPCEWSSWFQLPVWCSTKAFALSFSGFILADHLLCFSLSIFYNIFSSFCHYIPFPHTFLSICIAFLFLFFNFLPPSCNFIVPGKDSKTEVAPASPVALVPEEKVSFSLYALSVSTLTVAKIRKVYNKLDSKAIAKQVRHTSAP